MSFSLLSEWVKRGLSPFDPTYAPLDRVALLITDTGATDEDVEILKEAGIHEVLRVPHLN